MQSQAKHALVTQERDLNTYAELWDASECGPLPPLRAAFLWAISVAPSQQRPPCQSILTGAATFWSRNGDALGVGASRCRLAQHGGNHGQRRQRFSAVLLYGIIRHGNCPRGREPAHLMQPLCLATLLGQCVQVRENVAGD